MAFAACLACVTHSEILAPPGPTKPHQTRPGSGLEKATAKFSSLFSAPAHNRETDTSSQIDVCNPLLTAQHAMRNREILVQQWDATQVGT